MLGPPRREAFSAAFKDLSPKRRKNLKLQERVAVITGSARGQMRFLPTGIRAWPGCTRRATRSSI